MKQFILETGPGKDGLVRLEGDAYRYLVRVRRLAPGEYFPALLPDGAEVSVRVLSVDNKTLVGEIIPQTTEFPPPSSLASSASSVPLRENIASNFSLILFQALPKGDKMDLIVRQAAEGGVAEITPFVSEFSMVKINENQKLSRWRRIIKEARQQSGSKVETKICPPVSLDGLFSRWERIQAAWPNSVGLLFHQTPLANESLHGYLGKSQGLSPEAVVVTIGPEGGFSPAEAERFMAAGFKPFTIGDTVLRTETAALYAQAAVRILLLERDSWETK